MVNDEVIQKFDYIRESVDLNVKGFNKRYKNAKRSALGMKFALIVISAGITFVLAMEFKYSSQVALIMSFLLTVLTTLNQFARITTKHEELRKKAAYFIQLQFDLTYYQMGKEKLEEKDCEIFKKRLNAVLDEVIQSESNQHNETILKEPEK